MKKIITLEQLERLNACEEQKRKFKRYFGEKVILTQAIAKKHALRFDFEWASVSLLYQKDYKKWMSFYNKNDRKIDKKLLTSEQACSLEAQYFAKLYKGEKKYYRYIKI
jgi:hypothetical protein